MDWSHLAKVEQSKNWLPWLIRYMASQFNTLWISRNKDRHSHDTGAQHQSKLAQARRDITSSTPTEIMSSHKTKICSVHLSRLTFYNLYPNSIVG